MTSEQIIKNFIAKQSVFEVATISEFGYTENQINQMMKEYATLCCKAQRIACANNVNPVAETLKELEDSILNTEITLL